jgi:hypothetical protein
VELTRYEFLSRARFALHQDRRVRRGDTLHQVERPLHAGVLRDDAHTRRVPPGRSLEPLGARDHRLHARGLQNRRDQPIAIDRFLEKVEGPELHGARRGLDGPVPGEEHDLRSVRVLADGLHELKPVELRHAEVEDRDVVDPLPKRLQGLRPSGREGEVVSIPPCVDEDVLDQRELVFLIVGHEDRDGTIAERRHTTGLPSPPIGRKNKGLPLKCQSPAGRSPRGQRATRCLGGTGKPSWGVFEWAAGPTPGGSSFAHSGRHAVGGIRPHSHVNICVT